MPGAALHTTVALPDRMPPGLMNVPVKTSWMQKMSGMRECYRLYFLFYPLALPSLDLSGYDLVISSSSGYAKGVHTNRDALHICYCHTPMRWAWSFDSYSAREEMGAAKRLLLPHLINVLRRWDVGASRQPDHFIANSRVVAQRIQLAYGRIAEVIHPPIDLARFCPSPNRTITILFCRVWFPISASTWLSRPAPYSGRRLLVIGDGPDRARLTAKAAPTPRSWAGSPMPKWSTTPPAAVRSSSLGKRIRHGAAGGRRCWTPYHCLSWRGRCGNHYRWRHRHLLRPAGSPIPGHRHRML